MIDLHMHTNYSDGSDSVIEVLKKAEEIKLEAISITDHDEVGAHIEIENMDPKEYFSGLMLTGAELSSSFRGVPIEILAYEIDVQKIKNSPYIVKRNGSAKQTEYLDQMKRVGRSIGLKFDEVLHIEGKSFASGTFAKEIFSHDENLPILAQYGLYKGGQDFYRAGQSNPNSIFHIDEAAGLPSPEKIIGEIQAAGGRAFLAHPLLYPFENKLETIEQFVQTYEDIGLECHYSLFTEEQKKQLLDICRRYKRLVSGGSDYHGKNKPSIKMGVGKGNLNITRDMVSWIDDPRWRNHETHNSSHIR